MKNYGVFDLNDLADRIAREQRKAARVKRVILIAAFAALTLAFGWQRHRTNQFRAATVKLLAKNDAIAKELAVANSKLKAMGQAMTVSVDARRLGKPWRFSGEMIVVFAGEEK